MCGSMCSAHAQVNINGALLITARQQFAAGCFFIKKLITQCTHLHERAHTHTNVPTMTALVWIQSGRLCQRAEPFVLRIRVTAQRLCRRGGGLHVRVCACAGKEFWVLAQRGYKAFICPLPLRTKKLLSRQRRAGQDSSGGAGALT